MSIFSYYDLDWLRHGIFYEDSIAIEQSDVYTICGNQSRDISTQGKTLLSEKQEGKRSVVRSDWQWKWTRI